jgi:hypothetical protein
MFVEEKRSGEKQSVAPTLWQRLGFCTAFVQIPPKAEPLESEAQGPSFAEFAAWLEQQPADKTYEWWNGSTCACARFAGSIGERSAWLKRGVAKPYVNNWQRLNAAAQVLPHTYGALLERVRKQL